MEYRIGVNKKFDMLREAEDRLDKLVPQASDLSEGNAAKVRDIDQIEKEAKSDNTGMVLLGGRVGLNQLQTANLAQARQLLEETIAKKISGTTFVLTVLT